jgi:hypothetical protein
MALFLLDNRDFLFRSGGVKKNLKIPKRISEMKNRRIDNTMAKRKS